MDLVAEKGLLIEHSALHLVRSLYVRSTINAPCLDDGRRRALIKVRINYLGI